MESQNDYTRKQACSLAVAQAQETAGHHLIIRNLCSTPCGWGGLGTTKVVISSARPLCPVPEGASYPGWKAVQGGCGWFVLQIHFLQLCSLGLLLPHGVEGNPVGEGTTRRGTATPVHRPQRPAGVFCLCEHGFSQISWQTDAGQAPRVPGHPRAQCVHSCAQAAAKGLKPRRRALHTSRPLLESRPAHARLACRTAWPGSRRSSGP